MNISLVFTKWISSIVLSKRFLIYKYSSRNIILVSAIDCLES
jgi:hypothetical protein